MVTVLLVFFVNNYNRFLLIFVFVLSGVGPPRKRGVGGVGGGQIIVGLPLVRHMPEAAPDTLSCLNCALCRMHTCTYTQLILSDPF